MQWEDTIIELIENGREDDDRNVTLLVGPEGTGKKYVLSRTVVRLSSEVFEELLSSEAGPNHIYKMPDVDPSIFQHVVRYMFMQSDWRFNGNLDDACSLIQVAEKYKLGELLRIICKQISDLNFERDHLVQNSNACFIFNVLRNVCCGEERLWEPVLNYICRNAKEVIDQKSFLELSSDALVDILREDSLAVRSELDVFKMVIRWGMANLRKQSKQCTTEDLRTVLEWPLRFIRFPNMKESEFKNYVQPTEILNPQQERSLLDWWDWRKTNDSLATPEVMFSTKPRNYFLDCSWDNTQLEDFRSVDSIRAELFQAKYNVECDSSNLKLTVSQLRKELDEKSVELEAFKAKFRRELQSSMVDFMKLLKQEVGAAKADLSSQISSIGGQMNSESEKLRTELEKTREELAEKLEEQKAKLDLCLIDTWKVFLNETDEMGAKFSNTFEDTEKYACSVLLKNNTSVPLLEPLSHFFYLSPSQCYKPMPQEVQSNQVATFGFTENSYGTCGLFSYRLGERRFLVSFYVYSNNRNEFALGFLPAGTTLDDNLYKGMRFADWVEKTDRKKVNCHAPSLEGAVEFGCYRARASMKSAKKALLTILLSNV